MSRSAYWIDHQTRALEYKVGDYVSQVGGNALPTGRVVEVWPAIGMVDVEWPTGNQRHPVEELQLLDRSESVAIAPETDSRPSTDMVRPGRGASASRVAHAFVKKALYWAGKDRKYRATQLEQSDGCYSCPRCKDIPLRKTNYKRIEGRSVRLLACPACLFVIRTKDIFGHPDCDAQCAREPVEDDIFGEVV